jgi:hypothetical protein
VSINGTVASKQEISGAFKVIRICQGATVIQVGNQGPIHLNLVVVNGGRGILTPWYQAPCSGKLAWVRPLID